MSDEPTDIDPSAGFDELTILKNRARTMGITFSNNIGIESLRAKINAKMSGEGEDEGPTESGSPEAPFDMKKFKAEQRKRLMAENMNLIRCRIQNLNPDKKELHGEIFTVGNDTIGVVRKFIPYGEVTDNGYHIPNIIYKLLEKRRFPNRTTKVDPKTKMPVTKTVMAKEFAIEVLPPLTPKELQDLATAQIAAGSIE